MNGSPIEKAETLVAEIRASKSVKERAAYAILHQDQAAEAIEDLIAYIQGFQLGSAAEHKRLVKLVSSLVTAIAPLFERNSTPFGRPSSNAEWLSGTAPRLRNAYEQAIEYLKT